MAHHVRVLPWQGSKSGPHPPHSGRVEKTFAGADALFHPPVMVLKLTAAAAARELSRVGSPPAQGADELDQVVRQSIRLLMAPRSGRAALQPCLGEPRQRELVSRIPDEQGLWGRKGTRPSELSNGQRLVLKVGAHFVRICAPKRETDPYAAPDTENRIHGPAAIDGHDVQAPK